MRWQRGVQAFFLAISIWPQSAFAGIGITPQAVTETLVWNGGDIIRTQDFCVRSVQQPSPSGNTPRPYSVSPDVLELTSGINTIPFSATWTDLITGNTQNLTAGAVTPETFTGDTAGCPNSPGGVNGRLIVTFDSADLVSAAPGAYTAVLRVTVANSGRGRSRFRSQITYTLTIPDSIRVTNLTTLDFGQFDGVSNITRQDTLCVFRRSGAPYTIVLSGANAPAGAFQMMRNTLGVNYSVTWNDGTGPQPITPNLPIIGLQNSYTLDEFCNNGAADNVTISVTVLAADISAQAQEPGDYLGILRVEVQAE